MHAFLCYFVHKHTVGGENNTVHAGTAGSNRNTLSVGCVINSTTFKDLSVDTIQRREPNKLHWLQHNSLKLLCCVLILRWTLCPASVQLWRTNCKTTFLSPRSNKQLNPFFNINIEIYINAPLSLVHQSTRYNADWQLINPTVTLARGERGWWSSSEGVLASWHCVCVNEQPLSPLSTGKVHDLLLAVGAVLTWSPSRRPARFLQSCVPVSHESAADPRALPAHYWQGGATSANMLLTRHPRAFTTCFLFEAARV